MRNSRGRRPARGGGPIGATIIAAVLLVVVLVGALVIAVVTGQFPATGG